MKPMNFIEWIQTKNLMELDFGSNDTYSSGKEKPDNTLNRISNNIISKSDPNSYTSVTQAPTAAKGNQKIVDIVKGQIGKLSPQNQKKYPLSDLTKAVAQNMGTDLMGNQ